MNRDDMLRVCDEMHTFTVLDFASAFEETPQMANFYLRNAVERKYLERVRVGQTYVYSVSEKGRRILAKLPAIDIGERCLPIAFDGISPEPGIAGGCCRDWRRDDMRLIEIDPGNVIQAWQCLHCGHKFPVATYNPH